MDGGPREIYHRFFRSKIQQTKPKLRYLANEHQKKPALPDHKRQRLADLALAALIHQQTVSRNSSNAIAPLGPTANRERNDSSTQEANGATPETRSSPSRRPQPQIQHPTILTQAIEATITATIPATTARAPPDLNST